MTPAKLIVNPSSFIVQKFHPFSSAGLRVVAIVALLIIILCSQSARAVKLYSYQSGNWNGTNVWTTDSTGSTLIGSATPASNDIVNILTGRTITVTANVATTGHTVTILVGAVLDLSTYSFTSVILNGQGKIRTSRVVSGVAKLPTISSGSFLLLNGGTVEYYASSGNFYIDDNIANYGHLLINLGSTAQVMTVRRDITVYGNMTINQGTFQINDATNAKRTLFVGADLTVASAGRISTGTGNPNTSGYTIDPVDLPPGGEFHEIFHEFTIDGNFTNYGTVRFTNLTAPDYGEFATNGAVTVRFTGEANNSIRCYGVTDFYNLIIDKGSDQTYIMTLFASNVNYFSLYGPNACRRFQDPPFTWDNPEVRKALWIKNGTLKFTGNIMIPSLAEGPVGTGNSDYAIGSSGQMWIAESTVSVYVTASAATGFPEAPVGSQGVSVYPGTAEQALSIYGTFRLSDGYFSTRHSAGIIFWSTENSNSVVIVEGGTLNATVIRSTWTAAGKTSYVQTGGTVILRGNETETGEMSDAAIFNIPNPNSSFIMSGGEIIIRDRNNGATPNGNGLYLNCDPGNYSVTGGVIRFETNPVNTPSIEIYSKPNLWNLEIKRLGNTGNSAVNLLYPLTVAKKLTIFPNATLNSGTGNYQVTCNGDFYIEPGGTYTPGTNTTTFYGKDVHFMWNDGTITSGLYNFTIDKNTGGVIMVSSGPSFTIRNDLFIKTGTLDDGGKILYVNGNVINNTIYSGAGKISMNRTNGTQIITGNGLGRFQNLELNNTNGAAGSAQIALASDITVTGNLTLANDRLFNISKYQLILTANALIQGTWSNSRFVQTAGKASNGGLVKQYTDTISFLYPVGTGTRYLPATVYLRKIPTTYGYISVRPVSGKHPYATSTNCLDAYWKVEETGFSGVKTGSVRFLFNYGTFPDNTAYVPGKYVPASWSYINDVTLVDESANTILFPGESAIPGEFTAGTPDAFGNVVAFYSRANGTWSTPSTWSNAGFGGAAATTIPGASNPVFIGNGSTYNHTVTLSTGGAKAGTLSIASGSVLDVGSTSGNNFGTALPGSTGKIRITTTGATALFPAGDFGDFLGSVGGTVEYYTTTASYTLPTLSETPTADSVSTYCFLQMTPGTGYSITLPNANIQIFRNMIVTGASTTGLARFTATATRSIIIRDDIVVTSGRLLFQNGTAQAVRVDSNIVVGSGAIFNLATTGTVVTNTLSIGGGITNNGTFDMSPSATYFCPVVFTGTNNATISGTGATTDFYDLTVDKGTTIDPILNVTSTAFTFSNNTDPLTLVNGTFRLTSAVTVSISSLLFDIPASSRLSANGGTINIGSTVSDDADINLAGTVEVLAGSINVGNLANNVNNDIEYSGAGTPTILVGGGTLFVNGQIRRSNINVLGSLVYDQSGGSVIVNGRNLQPTRAKLEVLNFNSVFNQSGGTLTIVRGAGTTYNDLYIRPESSKVIGGTVVFGNSYTEATTYNNYTLDTSVPLFNLTLDGTNTAKTLTLVVHGLTLKGSLLINNTSIFNADSLDVNIAGNFTNLNADANTGVNTGGFRPGSLQQVTIFNGTVNAQTIAGTNGNITNFAILVINNTNTVSTVTLQANTAVRVNRDLMLITGNLNDGGNIISVLRHITNSATHSGTGRISLIGPLEQIISGNGLGKFGNLACNPSYDVICATNLEITDTLILRSGKMFDIGSNFLKLSSTYASSVKNASATSYIRLTGLNSDLGVMKVYPATPLSFTFPIGVTGKYTPAAMNVTQSSGSGTITVNPVNTKHPCTIYAPDQQLNYYWHVVKAGFLGFQITMIYSYIQGDVTGNENQYVGNRFYNGAWDSPASGTVSASNNTITFTNKTFMDGDYTAGQSGEFGTVPVYYSRNATLGGEWGTPATWSTVSHAGAAATTYPNGQSVIIASGHTVTNSASSTIQCYAFSVTLNGTAILDLTSTVGHRLGMVSGTGTIKLIPASATYFVFPAGNFSAFTASSGGTVELTNTSGSAVLPYPTIYNNLVLKGAGTKQQLDADITLNGYLTNESPGTFVGSSVGKLTIAGNWTNNGVFTHNSGTVVFNGNTTLLGTNPPTVKNLVINSRKSLTGPAGQAFGVAGNWVNNGTFNHNNGTVNFVGNTEISGSAVATFNNIAIYSNSILTGKLNDNITMIGNWTNNGTFSHNNGKVTFDGTSLILGSSNTTFGGVIVNPSKYLTGPEEGEMSVALDFANNGNFIHNNCTVIFNGKNQGVSGTAPSEFMNLSILKGSSTTLGPADQTVRGIVLSHGTLNCDGKLTLLSDPYSTALIDGSGEGDVLGLLKMQRYLDRGFGYKYFSSPFQNAKVSELGDDMDLTAAFPTFYGYEENRYVTGWYRYIDPNYLLKPMEGYAVNFGPSSPPATADMNGIVNNNTLIPRTLFNHNFPYTKGFTLMGNPYPSPLDWDAENGWVRTNIDNALYYFNAGTTDQYTGTYSTYINGISSDNIANNIIGSMQGVFIHVTDGSYPVSATLIFTNDTRINELNPTFHKIGGSATPEIRLSARIAEENSIGDPLVVYFNADASMAFDKDRDALKLMNTDITVPNFYALSEEGRELSISGIPYPFDSVTVIPLCLSIKKSGTLIFELTALENMPFGLYFYLSDNKNGLMQNLQLHPDYFLYLKDGDYNGRFSLVISRYDLRHQPAADEPFHVYSSRNRIFVYTDPSENTTIDMVVCNMLGQEEYHTTFPGAGYREIDLDVRPGLYVACLRGGGRTYSKKIILTNPW